jgi:hypothetical protein
MGNARVVELGAYRDKAMTFVEGERMRLRIDDDALVADLRRERDHAPKQGVAHAMPPGFREHCDAPDMPIGQQTRAPNGLACAIFRDDVPALGIDAVPFERLRNLLLLDKHPPTNVFQHRLIPAPVGQPYAARLTHDSAYFDSASCARPSRTVSLQWPPTGSVSLSRQ